MKKTLVSKITALLLAFSLLIPSLASASVFNPNYLISDEEFTDIFSMEIGEIQAFLKKGYLADYKTDDVDGHNRYASEIIWRAAQRNGVNPKVILVMLQKEQSLVTDDTPTQSQLDWALGYGVCDSCTHEDSAIQRWKGFAKQINSTTLQFSEGYLTDLENSGVTVTGYGPGLACYIDGTTVIPANNATAALYTYTPHLEGNQNFSTIWKAWFSRNYPTGTLLQDENNNVWLIQYSERRQITSQAALLSRFDADMVIPASTTELGAYTEGTPISLPNYSLLWADDGAIYLLVDDTIRHIDSMEAFRSIGFSTDDLVKVTDEELSYYEVDEPITVDSVYPQGALLQDARTGGVYYVEESVKYPIYSREILKARFGSKTVTPLTPAELEPYALGAPIKFADGTLIGVTGDPTVFLVSEGLRRTITSEEIFLGFGFKWSSIIWTNETSVDLHTLGDDLEDIGFDNSEFSEAKF